MDFSCGNKVRNTHIRYYTTSDVGFNMKEIRRPQLYIAPNARPLYLAT